MTGIKVRHAEGGIADGPVVLLLRPLPQTISCSEPILNQLVEHCRLEAFDMPGFGRSEGGLDCMSFEAQSKFLDTFVRELKLNQVHIIGPDVGMLAALRYAIHREHDIARLLIGDGPGIENYQHKPDQSFDKNSPRSCNFVEYSGDDQRNSCQDK